MIFATGTWIYPSETNLNVLNCCAILGALIKSFSSPGLNNFTALQAIGGFMLSLVLCFQIKHNPIKQCCWLWGLSPLDWVMLCCYLGLCFLILHLGWLAQSGNQLTCSRWIESSLIGLSCHKISMTQMSLDHIILKPNFLLFKFHWKKYTFLYS